MWHDKTERKKYKPTAWWTNEIKEQFKIKKQIWKHYLKEDTEEKLKVYKEQNNKVNILVKEAKNNNREDFGN